jgi:hypothetical protein
VARLESLLHNFLNRVGRLPTEYEEESQRRERERCLQIILARLEKPVDAILKAKLYDTLRSATAANCQEYIRSAAKSALKQFEVGDDVAVIDAICTSDSDLPIL